MSRVIMKKTEKELNEFVNQAEKITGRTEKVPTGF